VVEEISVPLPLRTTQIPHRLAWDRTHSSAMRGQRLAALTFPKGLRKSGNSYSSLARRRNY